MESNHDYYSTEEEDVSFDDWEQPLTDSMPRILEMRPSPAGYYRKVLQYLPDPEICSFKKPDEVRFADGARLIEIPPECRPVRSMIKSKMLKQAHDALFSIGLFIERYGSAVALALQAGEDAGKLSRFLFGDVISPIAKIAADTCHIISLSTRGNRTNVIWQPMGWSSQRQRMRRQPHRLRNSYIRFGGRRRNRESRMLVARRSPRSPSSCAVLTSGLGEHR